jgi:Ala-tRNA(Pro) deacylase
MVGRAPRGHGRAIPTCPWLTQCADHCLTARAVLGLSSDDGPHSATLPPVPLPRSEEGPAMSCAQRLREFLDAHAAKYIVIAHSRAFTAQEVAASLHVPGREMAKSVIVRSPSRLAMVVVRAQDHVDLGRVSQALGESAVLANEIDISLKFPDCELGAMPPLGLLYGMPTLVDREIANDQEIVFNAGTHTEVVRMPYADYARLVEPRVLDLTMHVGQLIQ